MWARVHRVILDELGAPSELDWSHFAVDSVSVRAPKGDNRPDRMKDRSGSVVSRPVHVAVRVDADGCKDVLALRAGAYTAPVEEAAEQALDALAACGLGLRQVTT